MAITNPNRVVKVSQLNYFKTKADTLYQTKAIQTISGLEASTVEAALAELLTKIGNSDITFEKLTTANTGKLATYRFTKGSGTGATTMDIDIEKDLMRAIVGFVTITEGTGADAGKYFDGSTEVGSADGVTGAGVYLKSNEIDASGTATGTVKYADASAVIEYLTVGTQTGKAVQLTISSDHKITGDIAAGSVTKSMLASGVQASLDLADSALQEHQDITGKADKVSGATTGNFAGLDENGNLVDSGKKAADFQAAGSYKTTQTAVSDPTVPSTGTTDALAFIDTISQNANGEITATKKNVKVAVASTSGQGGSAGLMSAAQAEKLDAIAYAENADIDEMFA